MNPITPLTIVGHLTQFAIVVGLVARGRWRLSAFFGVYIACSLIRDVLMLYWPEQFFFQWFWLISQTILDTLKLGIVLEVGWRVFAEFPGAASVAQKAAVVILAVTTATLASVPLSSPPLTSFETAITAFNPRLNDGTIWLMAAFLVIASWYRVPVHRFHAALLTSLALYQVFFSSIFRIFVGREYEIVRRYVSALDNVGFALATCWWIYVAWRADNATDRAHRDTLRTLHGATDPSDGFAGLSESAIAPQRRLA